MNELIKQAALPVIDVTCLADWTVGGEGGSLCSFLLFETISAVEHGDWYNEGWGAYTKYSS